MGPNGHLYSYWNILDCLGQVCIWVELPVQRRLCPIFVRDVGSPDIHECFCGLTGSQRTPGFWGVTLVDKVSQMSQHCEKCCDIISDAHLNLCRDNEKYLY